MELHGDRGGLDDPAMVCGLGSIDGVSFMFIGHQKGRNTKVGRRGAAEGSCGAGRQKGCNTKVGRGLSGQLWGGAQNGCYAV